MTLTLRYCEYFYPRSPCGERPCGNAGIGTPISISIHALLAESDRLPTGGQLGTVYFYPRSPCGERRSFCKSNPQRWHFYPRSPCGERPLKKYPVILGRVISIHALLAESDDSSYGALDGASISIHALLAESDVSTTIITICIAQFLSTLSLRRATLC